MFNPLGRLLTRSLAGVALLAVGCAAPPSHELSQAAPVHVAPTSAPSTPIPSARASPKPAANTRPAESPLPHVAPRPALPDNTLALATRGMVNWWPFAGHAFDLAGNNHGTLNLGAAYGRSPGGLCLACDGVHAFADVGRPANLNRASYTLAAWIRSDIAQGSSEAVFSDHVHGDSMPSLGLMAGSALMGADPQGLQPVTLRWPCPPGWTHLTLAGNAAIVRVYVNGVVAATAPMRGPLWANPQAFTIGASRSSLTPPTMAPFKGLIADVMLFDRELAAEEVQALAQARKPGEAPVMGDPARAAADAVISDAEFDDLWADLGGASAPRAFAAVCQLARAGDADVQRIMKRMPSTLRAGAGIPALIAQLDDERWPMRESASQALAEQIEPARAALRAALANKPTHEARHRIETILATEKPARPGPLTTADARSLRAVLALQRLGTPAARAALREIAADLRRGPERLAAEAGLHAEENP